MGQVDSTLKYGIYHSYQLMPDDWVYATIFDVQYLSHITAQCVVIKPAGDIAEGRFEVRWIDADGRPIGGTSKKYFTPTRLWKRHTATFEVPENAIKARVHYEGGTQGYHFACAMVEPGEIASAFSFEVASRLVYITNEGAYLGLLNAGQIVTGKMLSPTGKMWVDLDKPEICMQGNDAKWKASPSNPLELTDKNGKFIGGLKKLANKIALVAGLISNDPTLSTYAEIGYPQGGGSGINIVAMDGSSAYISPYGTYFVIMVDGTQRLALYKDGGFVLWDENQVVRLYFGKNGDFYVNDGISSVSRIQVYPNGPAGITSGNGNTLGIDDTGAYKIINGTKTYL